MPKNERLDKFQALGDLKIIRNSSTFMSFLGERQKFLQKQVNMYIRDQKWTEAYGALAKHDDIDKMIERLDDVIKQLEEGQE